MTMHLQRGMTTINHGKTNYKLDTKQRKARDKALAEQRKLLKKVGINPDRDIDPRQFRVSYGSEVVNKQKQSVPKKVDTQQPTLWKDAGAKRHKPQTYSGKQKLIGIAMMHKSNLVPVFSDKDAKDISRMRRG